MTRFMMSECHLKLVLFQARRRIEELTSLIKTLLRASPADLPPVPLLVPDVVNSILVEEYRALPYRYELQLSGERCRLEVLRDFCNNLVV